jgi:DNA-binding CsgD family transcriptional regulator
VTTPFERAADPERFGWGDVDEIIRRLIAQGLTNAEILDALSRERWGPDGMSLADRRAYGIRIDALRELAARPEPRPDAHGPRPMITAAEVARTRQRLIADGELHGEREIARALGVSRGAVRWTEGKDRRR